MHVFLSPQNCTVATNLYKSICLASIFSKKKCSKKNYFLGTEKNNFFKKILLIMFFIFLQKYYSSIRYVCNLKIFLDSLLTTTYLKTKSVAAVSIVA